MAVKIKVEIAVKAEVELAVKMEVEMEVEIAVKIVKMVVKIEVEIAVKIKVEIAVKIVIEDGTEAEIEILDGTAEIVLETDHLIETGRETGGVDRIGEVIVGDEMRGEEEADLMTGSDSKVVEVTIRTKGVETWIRRKMETRRNKKKCSPESQSQVSCSFTQ